MAAYILRYLGQKGWKTFKPKYEPSGEGNKLLILSAVEIKNTWDFVISLDQKANLQVKDIAKLSPIKVDIDLLGYQNDIRISQYVVGSRIQNFPEGFSTEKHIPIVPYGPLAKLIVLCFHCRYHRDIDATVCFTLKEVYVVKARRIATTIDGKCITCKKKRLTAQGQVMGLLPKYRTSILPPFTSVSLDFWGPIEIQDEVIKRGPKVYKKGFGLLVTCHSTRAIHCDIVPDGTTDSFLLALRRLIAIRGDIRLIVSDAAKALEGVHEGAYATFKSWRQGWDEGALKRFGAGKGMVWRFTMPEGQHQNGAAEALIKAIKKLWHSSQKAKS